MKSHIQKIMFIVLSLCAGTSVAREAIKTAHFPDDFAWGVATSAHQVEGDSYNNTFYLAEQKHMQEQTTDANGRVVVHYAGKACDHYKRWKDDIKLIKQLGTNTYRFSIAWDKVQPTENYFDIKVIEHYADVCCELIKNGIRPAITLHHYTDPIWFAEKGGFADEKNIHYYVDFASIAIDEITRRIHKKLKKHQRTIREHAPLWFTFNSPSGYVAKCYLQGIFYPFEKGNMQRMAEALKNMVEAHAQLYRAAKTYQPTAQIGILKNIYQLEAWYPWDKLACYIGNNLVNKCIFNFFTRGMFNVYIPFKAKVYHTNEYAPETLDFIGLNYYSHAYMQNFKPAPDKKLQPTDNPNYRVYPEGLYKAIKEISREIAEPLNIPIYVTENGIATMNDNLREEFLHGYLGALSDAIADGYNVKGYIHWSLMDNYEWGNYNKKYGVYHVDFNTQKRTLKPGAHYYVDTIAQYHANHATHLATAIA